MRTRNADKEELVRQKAIELLVSDGLEGFSVNKLAKACEISVATLYIYYEDKDDLIISVALEEARRMTEIIMKDFDPDATFEAGMRRQWENRYKYMMENALTAQFFEHLRSSTYHDRVFTSILKEFKEPLSKFTKNAVERQEIAPMPLEVFWSIAYAPLYNLIRFHMEGKSIGGKLFTLKDKMVWQAFDLVMKALLL